MVSHGETIPKKNKETISLQSVRVNRTRRTNESMCVIMALTA